MSLRIGIDIGSTTVKVVVLDEQNKLLFRSYERHYSRPGTGLRDPPFHHRSAGGQTGENGHHRLCRSGCGQCLRH